MKVKSRSFRMIESKSEPSTNVNLGRSQAIHSGSRDVGYKWL